MKYLLSFIFLITVFFVNSKETRLSLLIEENQLLRIVDDAELIIIDVRSPKKYAISHIKNSINLFVDDTFSKGKRTDLVAPLSQLAKLFGNSGLTKASKIILYDDGVFIDAARLFWILETFGAKSVSILNIGFQSWTLHGNPITSMPRKLPPKDFIPSVSPTKVATYLSVRKILDNEDHSLIDVRPEKEFLGIESVTGEYGHIPTSINIPFTLNLDSEATKLLSKPKLLSLYSDFDISKPVTVYCNKGKQSALSYFVLRHLNYDVSAYDGSWFEWGSMQNLPKWQPKIQP
ncbi:MAG: hypothetical protein COA86_11655 [Kangiella sp.]|nr:MAG: hypothetical protein COA86_11655 [Kangiella sp.]